MLYVGQTWTSTEARMGNDGERYANSPDIYQAIKKYGVDNFAYQELAKCDTAVEADKTEDYYMEKYGTLDPTIGYNKKKAGSHGIHAEATKQQISKTLKTQYDAMTPEEKKKKVEPIAGWWGGKERGPHSQEWKDNNSDMMKRRHVEQGHPMQDKHHTEEAKQQISQKLTGRKNPGDWHRGKPQTSQEKESIIIEAYKQGINIKDIRDQFNVGQTTIYRILDRNNIPRSNNFTKWNGRTHSEETKSQMSISAKEVWKNRKDFE